MFSRKFSSKVIVQILLCFVIGLFAFPVQQSFGDFDIGLETLCYPQTIEQFKFYWYNKAELGSSITLTVGACDESTGDSGQGILFWTLTHPESELCGNCENTCVEHSECGMMIGQMFTVQVNGSQEDFDAFFPGGISLDGTSITKVNSKYGISAGSLPDIHATPSNPQLRKPGSTATFGLEFETYTLYMGCHSPIKTTTGNITVEVIKDVCARNAPPTGGANMQKITRVYGPDPCTADPEWRYIWHSSIYSCDPELCQFQSTELAYGNSTGIYHLAKIPCWNKPVSNDLPGYMTSAGWHTHHDPDYIYQDLGDQGKFFYDCSVNSTLQGEDQKLAASAEYCTPAQNKGQGIIQWRYEYDANDRIQCAYNGSSYSSSSKKYSYDWTNLGYGYSTADITYLINGETARQWHTEYDAKNQIVQSSDGSGCGSCGETTGFQKIEYYYTSDYNDSRFEGLIQKQYNYAGDVIRWDQYDANKLTDPAYIHTVQPILTSQAAIHNSQIIKFKDLVYDVNNFTITQYIWVDSGHARCIKSYYTDSGLTNIVRKIEYDQLTTSLAEPTGTTYTTYYSYDDVNGVKTTIYPSGKRKDVENYNSDKRVVESYSYDVDTTGIANHEQYSYSGSDLIEHTNARGGVTNYSQFININGRNYPQLEQRPQTSAGRQEIHYLYDGAARVKQEQRKDTNGNLVTTKYNYDVVTGNLNSQTEDFGGPNEATTIYQYNDFGQITRTKTPAGVVTGTHYNTAGQVESEFVLADANDINDVDSSLALISQTKYTYDSDGHTKTIRQAIDGCAFDFDDPNDWIITEYSYDFLGRKISEIQDVNGIELATSYEYNNQGELEKTIYPGGKWVKVVRDGRGLVTQNITGYGTTNVLVTGKEYDDNGNLIQQTNPDGTIELSYYDNFDRLERRQKQTSYGPYTDYYYDSASQLLREASYDANDILLMDARKEYNAIGRIWKERVCELPGYCNDANDIIKLYQFDVADNVRKVIRKGYGSLDSNNFDEPNDVINEYRYDSRGRRTEIIDGEGLSTFFGYDKDGRQLTVTDPNGFITTTYYDAGGRVYKTVDAEKNYRISYYDSLSRAFEQISFDCNGTATNFGDDVELEQIRLEYDNLNHQLRQAIMKNPASTSAVNTAIDMVEDSIYDSNTGSIYQQKKYYNGSQTATTVYYYDEIGRKERVVDPEGNEQRFYYENSTYPARLTKQEQINYNSSGSITVATLFDYDNFGRVYTSTVDRSSASDITTTYYYDDLGRNKSIVAVDGVITAFEYDAFGNQNRKIEDAGNKNKTTDYKFDRLGRQASITGYDPNVQTTRYTYNKNDKVIQITYPDGNSINYYYDICGTIDQETKRDNSSIYYSYDAIDRVLEESDSLTNPTFIANFEYDGAGRLVSTSKMADGVTVSQSAFTYNGFGLKETETTTYDSNSNTTATITYSYDQSGNILLQEDSITGAVIEYTYDGLGRIKTVEKDGTQIAEYSYIGTQVKTKEYTQAEIFTTNGFDDIGRLEEIASVKGSETLLDLIYTYDDLSNRTSVKYNHLETPVWDKYTYDELRRLIYVEYGSLSGWSMNKSIIDIQVASAIALKWLSADSIDFEGLYIKALSKARPQQNIIEEVKSKMQAYKNYRNIYANVVALAVLDSNESTTTTETINDENGNKSAEIIYDNQQRIISFALFLDDGSKVVIETSFDTTPATEVVRQYDATGTLVDEQTLIQESVTASAPTPNETASLPLYDSFEQEVDFVFDNGGGMMLMGMEASGPQYATEEFEYDNLGNRLTHYTKEGFTNTYYHNNLNQYDGIYYDYGWGLTYDANLFYDDNGNMEFDENGISYQYDYRNRLVNVPDGTTSLVEFTYDSLGRRIKKTTDSTTTYYYYDTMGRVIAEVSNNTWQRNFVYGNGFDEVLGMFTPEPYSSVEPNDINWLVGFCDAWLTTSSTYNEDSDPNVNFRDYAKHLSDHPWQTVFPDTSTETDYYYLTDALGSVMGVIGSKYGREEDREFFTYDAYGKPDSLSVFGNPYMFTGKRVDDVQGIWLQENLNRTYSYSLGRWMQPDPRGIVPNGNSINPFSPLVQTGDGMNLFEYVRSNSINKTDKFGLCECGSLTYIRKCSASRVNTYPYNNLETVPYVGDLIDGYNPIQSPIGIDLPTLSSATQAGVIVWRIENCTGYGFYCPAGSSRLLYGPLYGRLTPYNQVVLQDPQEIQPSDDDPAWKRAEHEAIEGLGEPCQGISFSKLVIHRNGWRTHMTCDMKGRCVTVTYK